LLDVCLSSNIINYGVVGGILGFDLVHVSASAKIPLCIYRYLFELIHQRRGVFEGFGVAIVKAFGENLIDDPVFACNLSAYALYRCRMYLHQYAITGFAVSSCDARTMNLVKSADFNLAGTCAAIVMRSSLEE
jgi:hypothetical protein